MSTPTRIRSIVDTFLRSEYFADWQSENLDYCGLGLRRGDMDRANRCFEASENGADGSTHRECIADMRQAFKDYVRRNSRWAYPDRLVDAVMLHFDSIEQWHIDNGSIDQEVG